MRGVPTRTTDRRRRSRVVASPHALVQAQLAQASLLAVHAERAEVFITALEAGWTMRELGDAVGMSASTICRIVADGEARQDEAGGTASPLPVVEEGRDA